MTGLRHVLGVGGVLGGHVLGSGHLFGGAGVLSGAGALGGAGALAWALLGCAVLLVPRSRHGRAGQPGERPAGPSVGPATASRPEAASGTTVFASPELAAAASTSVRRRHRHRVRATGAAPTAEPPDDRFARTAATGVGARAGPLLAAGAVGGASVALLGPSRVAVFAVAVLAPATWGLLSWLQRRPTRATADPALPLVLDLAAAALRSGRPVAEALASAAPAARPDVARDLLRVAGLYRLGADAEQAWGGVDTAGPMGAVVTVAVRSAASGIKVANAFERLAAELRAERAAALASRAHRAGVVALGPLAACFLPSFVCLGVVPVVVGIARSAFGLLPS